MGTPSRGRGVGNFYNNLGITGKEYISLLPWKKRKNGDEESALDEDVWSESESANHPITRPHSSYSLEEGDLMFMRYSGGQTDSDPTATTPTARSQHLLSAVEDKDLSSAEYFLQLGADPDAKLGIHLITAIHVAVGLRQPHMVSLLIKYKANVNAADSRGVTPLHLAANHEDAEIAEKLLRAGASVNCRDFTRSDGTGSETPLHRAASAGNLQLVNAFIQAGAEVDAADARGRTPLHYAAQRSATGCLKALIDHGADPNASDNHGTTALLLLGGTFILKNRRRNVGYTESVQVLVKGGAKVNVVDVHTYITPLHQAARLGRVDAVEFLLNAGAKTNVQDHEKIIPLHIAALKGQAKAVQLLVKSPTGPDDIHVADAQGRTALHKAAYRGSAECIQILIKSGADLGAKTASGVSAATVILQLPNGPKILRQCLDASVLSNNVDPTEYACRLTFDYSLLMTSHKKQQMTIIEDIIDEGRNPQIAELLQHPLVESFLILKWRKIRCLFFVNVFLYLALVIGITLLVLFNVCENTPLARAATSDYLLGFHQYSLYVIILLIIIQEIVQIGSLHIQYIREAESWLKLGAVTTSIATVIGVAGIVEPWAKHTGAFAVFLTWTELMLLLGRLPTFGVYSLMFYTVAQQLVKFIAGFFCFIAGFAFSFHVIFQNKPAFKTPWSALLRTTAMMVGDMDFDAYFFSEEPQTTTSDAIIFKEPVAEAPSVSRYLEGTAQIFYFLFLMLVSLVLMNLLIGLAVSDIQGLQKEGRIKRLKKQAQFLVYLEDLAHCLLLRVLLPKSLNHRLCEWINIDTTIHLHPAMRKPKICLPSSTMENALAIIQDVSPPIDRVTIRDVYHLVLEYKAGMEEIQQKVSSLEKYLRLEIPENEDSAETAETPDNQIEDFSSDNSLADVDETDGVPYARRSQDDIGGRSIWSELDEIKRLLSAVAQQQKQTQ